MANALKQPTHEISSLARELAINKLRLAALKAMNDLPPSQDEIESAQILQSALQRTIAEYRPGSAYERALLPPDIPDGDLTEALSALKSKSRRPTSLDRDAIEILLPLLDALVHQRLTPADAERLLLQLQRIDSAATAARPTHPLEWATNE